MKKEYETVVVQPKQTHNGVRFSEELVKVEFVGTEIVRCKDCKHLMTYNDGTYDCKYLAERMFAEGELNNKPNDFCCWGRAKGERQC